MKGNIIFLVCDPCQKANEADFGAKIAGRTQRGYYATMIPGKQMNNWLAKHAKCGGRTNPDHFRLGYQQAQNADQSELEAAVKLAVID